MCSIDHLIFVADAYKAATGVTEDKTVSHRVFGDAKKLRALRIGADITTRRLWSALLWFSENWPEGHSKPRILNEKDVLFGVSSPDEQDAA